MKTEIERKFLVAQMPDITGLPKISYERYFLFCDFQTEIRIQKKWDNYEFERKVKETELSAEKLKFEITKNEFEELKKRSIWEILRDSYIISSSPGISLKVYHWNLEWFQRIEVEFESENDSQNFTIPEWFGKEITGTAFARDSNIMNVSCMNMKT